MNNKKDMHITAVLCCLVVGILLMFAIIKGIKESNTCASKIYTVIIGDKTYSGCTNVTVHSGNGTIYFDCNGKTYRAYGYTITEERND